MHIFIQRSNYLKSIRTLPEENYAQDILSELLQPMIVLDMSENKLISQSIRHIYVLCEIDLNSSHC